MKGNVQASRNAACNMENGLEQREKIRFGVRALAKFEWFDGQGARHREQGYTRDISSKGLFIFSYTLPPAKVDLQINVFLGDMPGAEQNLELNAKALVIRSEPATNPGSYGGFAVLNRSYSLANQASTLGPEGDSENEPN